MLNIFATSIAVIHINELACAEVVCEIPGDFRPRRAAEILNWPTTGTVAIPSPASGRK